jgi:hypothetical protein
MTPFDPVDFSMPLDPYDDPRRGLKAKVFVPAMGLIAIGVLSVAYAIFTSVMSGQTKANIDTQIRQVEISRAFDAGQKKQIQLLLRRYKDSMPVFNGLSAVCGAIIGIGGVQMLSLSARPVCYAAAILSILPFTNCCCCLGCVFGVWAIVVMNLPDVRSGFAYQNNLGSRT